MEKSERSQTYRRSGRHPERTDERHNDSGLGDQTKPMKLLHVVASYAPAWRYGGPVQSVAALCQGLARLGEDVTVYTTNVDGASDLAVPLGQPVVRHGVKVHYFQVQPPRHWSFSWALTRALQKEVANFDLVHLHGVFVYPALAAGFYCRKYGIPYFLSPRGMLCNVAYGMKSLRKRMYLALLERRNLNAARAVHFTTIDEQRQMIPIRLGPPAFVVPNSLDLDAFASLPAYGSFRAKHPETTGKRLILFLGRMHRIKGLDRLAEAFGRAREKIQDAHLVIAGYDLEGYGRVVRGRLREQGILERVTFTGPLVGEDKLAAFRDCDLFVLPSYQENFGMAALEAMACGLPVVVSKGVYLYPEIEQAGAGLVVDGDPAGLAGAFEMLLQDSTLRARMGEAGRWLVRERFSAERVADQMRSVYRNILAGTTQARQWA